MDPRAFNLAAITNILRLIGRPELCLPQATISTFAHLPIPVNKAFEQSERVDIKAVVLDKDNCFAYPKSNEVFKPYEVGSLSACQDLVGADVIGSLSTPTRGLSWPTLADSVEHSWRISD